MRFFETLKDAKREAMENENVFKMYESYIVCTDEEYKEYCEMCELEKQMCELLNQMRELEKQEIELEKQMIMK